MATTWRRAPRGQPLLAVSLRLLTSSWTLGSGLLLAVVAVAVAVLFTIPTPYQVLLPGPVTDVQRLIEPNPEPVQGALYLTTIYSDPASVGEWLIAKINPEAGIVPREAARPRDVSENDYRKLLTTMMDDSKVVAQVVALREAGYDVKVSGQGAQIEELAEGSRAEGILQKGDVIVAADGQPVTTSNDLVAMIQNHLPGDTVRLQVKRGQATLDVDVPLGESQAEPGRARMGVIVLTHLYEYELPKELDLKTKDIGGPSGGLMFALGVYNAVTPGDITHGRKIAGTGTIATDGDVGAVGAVRFKVMAAEKAGAEVFLVPADNYQEASGVARRLHLIPVRTFAEALNALRRLPSE
jgi:PDZ domain-containing protein